MTATILRGDALALPLNDSTVDLIVTSPPYFGLRSYQDDGAHYSGQLGSEATPAEFVDALIGATREMVRVLRPSGSIWVNLGDRYAGNGGGGTGSSDGTTGRGPRPVRGNVGIPTKSLIGVPWRYALRCIDDLGLILRAEVIWAKPNGLPESVTDRVRRSHETWFHFVTEPRYFSAVDEVREIYAPATAERYAAGMRPSAVAASGVTANGPLRRDDAGPSSTNPLGKLPGSVWTVPTQPLTVPASLGVDHFAAFPMEWPRRIIRGWSPPGVCVECGQGRRPLRTDEYVKLWNHTPNKTAANPDNNLESFSVKGRGYVVREITGYACDCPDTTAPTRPAVILDPFGGTGTTALVAHALGRHGISVDMSADYCRLARWRTTDPGQLAAALQVEKPEPARQTESLFDLLDGAARP